MADQCVIEATGGRVELARGDITTFVGDAIVNAANPGLLGGGGVDGAIHRAAGPELYAECKRIVDRNGPLSPGSAVLTGGGRLPAPYVIHTVGPIWRGGGAGEADTLASAYRQSLRVARGKGLRRVAFPSISTGAYGYPLRQAAEVALRAVVDELSEATEPPLDVTFVLYDDPSYVAYEDALADLCGEQDSAEHRES